MTKFSIKNIFIFISILLLCENLALGETILPKPRPKLENLIKREIIIPKPIPKLEELTKKKQLNQKPHLR